MAVSTGMDKRTSSHDGNMMADMIGKDKLTSIVSSAQVRVCVFFFFYVYYIISRFFFINFFPVACPAPLYFFFFLPLYFRRRCDASKTARYYSGIIQVFNFVSFRRIFSRSGTCSAAVGG